jgi:hypothetical protein
MERFCLEAIKADRISERGKRTAHALPRCNRRKSEVGDRLVHVREAECLHHGLARARISFYTNAGRLARLAVFGKGSCVGDRVRVLCSVTSWAIVAVTPQTNAD